MSRSGLPAAVDARGVVIAAVVACVVIPTPALAQTPRLTGPTVVASGSAARLVAIRAEPGERVRLEVRRAGSWRGVGRERAGGRGRARFEFRTRGRRGRYRLRAVAGERRSRPIVLRSRPVSIASVGDINLGNGPAAVMRARGRRYPWRRVAPVLRRADIAFGNLECAVSRRGRPVPKQYNFRGRPRALRTAVRFAGMDVFNLANNHAGDYGRTALMDTIRHARRFGAVTVGAGRNLERARAVRVVERLGLRVAFVGFNEILPASFAAGPSRAGTAFMSPAAVRKGIRRARRRADVVIATFHWGVERASRPNARQRSYARLSLRAGADAVIGAHPHVLQPVRRRGRGVIAYSLGNFIWTPGSAATARTGILDLRVSARGVERSRLRPAYIVGGQPRLRR